jgi:hypothetical protein
MILPAGLDNARLGLSSMSHPSQHATVGVVGYRTALRGAGCFHPNASAGAPH